MKLSSVFRDGLGCLVIVTACLFALAVGLSVGENLSGAFSVHITIDK
jgi:hypothetical protein